MCFRVCLQLQQTKKFMINNFTIEKYFVNSNFPSFLVVLFSNSFVLISIKTHLFTLICLLLTK